MTVCSVEGCGKIHHARTYCESHYRKLILNPSRLSTSCSVYECSKPIGYESGKKKLCSSHFMKLKRYGTTDHPTKERQNFNWSALSTEDKFKVEFKDRVNFTRRAREFFPNKCMRCGWDKGTVQVHHVIEETKGGKHRLDNVEMVCPNCHEEEHYNRRNALRGAQ